ncbi:MAG: ribonuclease HI [Rhodobacteraceae bacterium]|nr:ribonuclease HI [Paracoccaceae bacterium]
MTRIIAYTDGACSGNPGPGGWGVVLQACGSGGEILKEKAFCGGCADTTNNRMELTAAIEALDRLARPSDVMLRTDSKYLADGITLWIHGWKKRDWKNSGRKPVKNADLWQRLDGLCGRHSVTWQWVKGHANEAGNERADQLAREGMQPWINRG